jgi:hypothetical protein
MAAIKELKQHQPKPHCFWNIYWLALPVCWEQEEHSQVTIERLSSLLTSFVNQNNYVDVVLVCAKKAVYSHAQILQKAAFSERHEDKK